MEKLTEILGRNQPQFNTVTTTTSVKDALFKMYCEHVDYLIVNENDKFVGILTEHDVAGKVLFTDKPLQNTQVREFMTTEIPVIREDDYVEYAMQLLDHYNAQYFALYDGFTFKAIVNAQDLMRKALRKRQSTVYSDEERQKNFWNY